MLLFVAVPLLEIMVIVQVGAVIGGWATFGLLVADSLVGAWLLRVEGRRAWAQFRRALAEARWPGDEVAQGALIIVGGTLLVTPGFITDVVGFLLLIGGTRRVVADQVRKRFTGATGIPGGRRTRGRGTAESADPFKHERRGNVPLDVEVVEIEREQPPPERSDSGEPDSDGPGGPDDRAHPGQD